MVDERPHRRIFELLACIIVCGICLQILTVSDIINNVTMRTSPEQLFYDKFVAEQHFRWNRSANFPAQFDDRNCFFNQTATENMQHVCGFSMETCLNNSQLRLFVPDFELTPWTSLETKYGTLRSGSWAPCECRSQTRMAVVVPYRLRKFHLNVFLNNIIALLQFQRQAFTIFIIEHTHDVAFNRGASFNAAFRIIQRLRYKYDCYVLHDVDMVNENLCNYYQCGAHPRHLSVQVEKAGYALYYKQYVGGVTALSTSIVEQINGMSNLFFGWGGEDDNLYARLVRRQNYRVQRYDANIGRYATLEHEHSEKLNTEMTLHKVSVCTCTHCACTRRITCPHC